MKPPRNLDDLTKCVKYLNDRLWVYCVECESWAEVGLTCRVEVVCNQQGDVIKFTPETEPVFICGWHGCHADVGYLLSEAQQFRLREKAGFKNPRVEARVIERKEAGQLRLI